MIKLIPNFPNYLANTKGNIYSLRPIRRFAKPPIKPRKLKGTIHGKYKCVGLMKNKKLHYRRIAPLILETFISPRPKGKYACHKSLNSFNNNLNNLYWGTPKQNSQDMVRANRQAKGEQNGFARFNKEEIIKIRKSYNPLKGISHRFLAKKYKTSRSHIARIIKREAWKHI
uniref:Putative structural protein n=1 Tax=viral metagenome TaxID=1070528 RepID=A0A6M3KG44_9ZZZZ